MCSSANTKLRKMKFPGAALIPCLALVSQWRAAVCLDTVGELICRNMDPGSRLPHPEFCNVYIMCTNHSATQFSCERRILYNPETEVCDPEYQVCPGGIIRNQNGAIEEYRLEETESKLQPTEDFREFSALTTTTSTEVPATQSSTPSTSLPSTMWLPTPSQSQKLATCPDQDSEKLLLIGHPSKCSVYFVCYHGRPVLMECSMGLHWSEKSYKCVPRELSECHTRTANPYPKCPARGIDFLPDDRNCHHFWYCRDGFRTLQQCDAFFQWDVNTRKCTRATQAVCYVDLLQSTAPTVSN